MPTTDEDIRAEARAAQYQSSPVATQIMRWLPVLVIAAGGLTSYASLRAETSELARRADRIESQQRENSASLERRLDAISGDLRSLTTVVVELRTELRVRSEPAVRPERQRNP